LPPLVRWLGVASAGKEEHAAEYEAEITARRNALTKALEALEEKSHDPAMSEEVLKLLHARHETRTNQLPAALDDDSHQVTVAGANLTRELIGVERRCIHTLLRNGGITDETRRRIERDLDLEEASLANRQYIKTPL
jgi:hypothetical protein